MSKDVFLPSTTQQAFHAVSRAIVSGLNPADVKKLGDLALLPDEFVPFIAYALGVYYEGVMSGRDFDGALIQELYALHRTKGTGDGLQDALDLIPSLACAVAETGPGTAKIDVLFDPETGFNETVWRYFHYIVKDFKRFTCHVKVTVSNRFAAGHKRGAGGRFSRKFRAVAELNTVLIGIVTGGLHADTGAAETVWPFQSQIIKKMVMSGNF